MLLSFIIPAHNEELEIGCALNAIRAAASSQPHEIIVVDDASTDATAQIAATHGARIVRIDRRHIAAARNAGARAASGDALFFVDADTQISAVHVSGALRALAAGCAGGGARVHVAEEIPTWAKLFFRTFSAIYFAANLGAGAFLFTTAEHFRAIGGFDEQYFASEEVHFTLALKKRGRFVLLREPVLTSGRKLRMNPARKLLFDFARLVLGGKRAVRSRDKLDLWYDGRRETRAV